MTTVTLRRTHNRNWGVFQKQTVSGGGYYTYPKCSCPDCTGMAHVKYEILRNDVWVPLYVNVDKANVLAWTKGFCMQVVTEDGTILA